MLRSVIDEGKDLARKNLNEKFKNQSSLDDLDSYTVYLEKELNKVNNLLNSTIQNKLDSLKRAVDFMDDSSNRLMKLTQDISAVDQKIMTSDTSIIKYNKLKRIQNAKTNLTLVLKQIELFFKIPYQVKNLLNILKTNELYLKDCYLEFIKMLALRQGLIKETIASSTKNIDSMNQIERTLKIEEIRKNTLENVDKKLSCVTEGFQTLFQYALNIIDNLYYNAETRPQLLVMSFEIFELHNDYNKRRLKVYAKKKKYLEKILQELQQSKLTNSSNNPTNYNNPNRNLNRNMARNAQNNSENLTLQSQISYYYSIYYHLYIDDDIREDILTLVENSILGQIKKEIKEEFDVVERYNEEEKKRIARDPNSKKVSSEINELIEATHRILTKIKDYEYIILPCVPPHYKIITLFLKNFENSLKKWLKKIEDNVTNFIVSEILNLINWFEIIEVTILYISDCEKENLEELNKQLYESEFDQEFEGLFENDEGVNEEKENEKKRQQNYQKLYDEICENLKDYEAIKHRLIIEYQIRIKVQLNEWFSNIKDQEIELRTNESGNLITPNPEDMFNIIHTQLVIAREKLPLKYINEVSNACLQVLREVQRETYDGLLGKDDGTSANAPNAQNNLTNTQLTSISTSGKSKNENYSNVELMCAMINDNLRLNTKCDEFYEKVERIVQENEANNNYKEEEKALMEESNKNLLQSINEVSIEYIQIAEKTVVFLSRIIIEEIEEEIFNRIFSMEWQNETSNICESLVATYEDYFNDLSTWLSSHYFYKLLRNIFELTIKYYIMAIRKHAGTNNFYFLKELSVASKIYHDCYVLAEFFSKYQKELRYGGLKVSPNYTPTMDFKINTSIPLEPALLEQFEPFCLISKLLSDRNKRQPEINTLIFKRFGFDGLRALQGYAVSIPASKQDKINFFDYLEKNYEAFMKKFQPKSTETINYNASSPEFANWDQYNSFIAEKNLQQTGITNKFFFWGRKI